MQPRRQLRTFLTLGLTFAIALGSAASARAEDAPLLTPAAFAAPAKKATPIFTAAAAQAAQTPTTAANDHQFGVGARVGGFDFGIGASVRYFFYNGPLGVQAEVSRYGLDIGSRDFSSVQFAPAVIYRFHEFEQRFEAPLSLTPYAGGGLSFIHSDIDDDLFDLLDVDDTSVGVLLFGGVEFSFDQIPNLGVSAELTFNSNGDIGPTSIGGVGITGAAHWYFW